MSSKYSLNRRTVLRGLAGGGLSATVGLPMLECMLNANGNALAQGGGAIPVRYGIFFWGNGVRPDRWIPGKVGANWWTDAGEELAVIANDEAIRSKVNVFSRFSLMIRRGTAHHTARAQLLTGTYEPSPDGVCCGRATGPSSDWIVRKAWAGRTRLDAFDVGISQQGKGSGFFINNGTVHDDDGNRPVIEMSPRAAYTTLFGNGLPESVAEVDVENFKVARLRVVDLVRQDAARLRRRLGVNDKRRLDAHLEQLRGVERDIEALESEPSSCQLPGGGEPSSADEFLQQVTVNRDGGQLTTTGELLAEKNDVMAELSALALACDQTRVLTYQHHGMQTDTLFWNLPGVSLGSHQSTHDDRNTSPDPQARDFEAVHEIATFVMGQFARLVRALDGISEGDGTVLDNCALLATSEYGDASTHSLDSMLALTAGSAGGALRTGRHFDGNGRNAVDIPFTLMRSVGIDINGFGQGASRSTDEFSAMLAR